LQSGLIINLVRLSPKRKEILIINLVWLIAERQIKNITNSCVYFMAIAKKQTKKYVPLYEILFNFAH